MFSIFKSWKLGSLESQFDNGFKIEITGLLRSHKLGYISFDTSVPEPKYLIHKKRDGSIGKFMILSSEVDQMNGQFAKRFETVSGDGNPFKFLFIPNQNTLLITDMRDMFNGRPGHFETPNIPPNSPLSFLLPHDSKDQNKFKSILLNEEINRIPGMSISEETTIIGLIEFNDGEVIKIKNDLYKKFTDIYIDDENEPKTVRKMESIMFTIKEYVRIEELYQKMKPLSYLTLIEYHDDDDPTPINTPYDEKLKISESYIEIYRNENKTLFKMVVLKHAKCKKDSD